MVKNIVIYELPNCPQCKATKRFLDKRGIGYTTESASDNAKTLNQKGYTTAPVVVTYNELGETDSWSGYNVDKLKGIC